jgi:general secretion pathway protein A
VREVFAFSEGYPRLINIVCDHALLTGFVQGVARISGSIVSECAEELRIQSVRSTDPDPPAAEPAPVVMPAPTVYPPPPEPEKDRGLTSAQTMLIVIIGILCFVAGLMVFSLRSRSPSAGEATSTPAANVISETPATETPPPTTPVAVRVPVTPGETQTAAVEPEKATPPEPVAAIVDPAPLPAAEPEPDPPAEALPPASDLPVPAEPAIEAPPALTADQTRLLDDMLAGTENLMINFKIDSNELTLEDMQDLDLIATLLNTRDDIAARVTGYTDAVGNLHYNLKVSEFRANIVKTYLVGKGVEAGRVTSVGMGPANPIDSNDTLEGRRRNRRVEVEFQTDEASSLPD